MSLILDALRKSETQRQQLGNVALADLPHGKRQKAPWWLYAVGLLLAANLLLLAVVLLRPSSPATPVATVPTNKIASAPAATNPTTSVRTTANPNQTPTYSAPLGEPLAEAATPTPQVEYENVDRSVMDAASNPPQGNSLVRSINSNADQNTINLLNSTAPASVPPLRLEMHVYAPVAANRFVFINGHKYSEGQAMIEGPQVESIVADGVILSMQGTRWRVDRP